MIKGQKIVRKDGTECAGYPGKTLRLSQDVMGLYSHAGSMAIDDTGEDNGQDNRYATAKIICSWKDAPGGVNGVNWQTVKPTYCADKKTRYFTFREVHDDYIGDVKVGDVREQGDFIGNEGNTGGGSTGNHSHFVVGDGLIAGQGLVRNEFGVYEMKNELAPWDVFFVNGTTIVDGRGHPWKTFSEPVLTYEVHVASIGDMPPVKEGDVCGAQVGRGKQIEAIKINFDGYPDAILKYRVHVQDIGWMPWVEGGNWAGTKGKGLRLEAIEIVLNATGLTLEGTEHIAGIGWMPPSKGNTIMMGVTTKGKALENFKLNIL